MEFSIADRIRYLRDKAGMTQTDLAKMLKITRSAVNAWEMSLSMPSVASIVQLTQIFHVSADFILSTSDKVLLDITDLDSKEREVVFRMIECFEKNKEKNMDK